MGADAYREVMAARAWTRVFRRAGRRTNLALLVLLTGAFGTGWLAFAAGTPVPARLATVSHGLFGLGLVVLVPWKRVVISRAPRLQVASLALLGMVALCLLAGFVEVFAGYGLWGGLSPIQVHVSAAVVLVPLLVLHVREHRRQRVRRRDASRRSLLRTAGFAVGIGAGWLALEGAGRAAGLASASRLATGSHRIPAAEMPATTWLFDRTPSLPADHRVRLEGRDVGWAELDRRGGPVVARLDCTSGWYAEATWTGVRLADLLDPAAATGAASVEVRSVTGYRRRFPVAELGQRWLATRCDGRLLASGAGAPVRLVAPHRRGFWWVKWVESVTWSDRPPSLQSPFPLQ
ncbi:MAG: Oxidoreductase molybdopterin binding protein [Friedmanniella sp.]|nr:Oxidoreductase molybdopterin binding protein [Friedmanniella sp.]